MSCDRGVKRCQAAGAAAGLPGQVARTTWEQGRRDMAGSGGLNLADMDRARLLALREEIDRVLALPPDSRSGEGPPGDAAGESVGGKAVDASVLPPTGERRTERRDLDAASSVGAQALTGPGVAVGGREQGEPPPTTAGGGGPSGSQQGQGAGGGQGWIEIKRIHGRAYLYRRWREDGRKRSKYLGPA
jgi:hypothetical protein